LIDVDLRLKARHDVAVGGDPLSPLLLEEPETALVTSDIVENTTSKLPTGRVRMYAIAFDLDTTQLQIEYPNTSWQNAYVDIRKILLPLGFDWQQGSVHFGNQDMNAVRCVLAVQTLSNSLSWFKSSVRDIRMLRIEELNDLSPAL